MKFIHTSDWHLGHTLYDYDRREEQSSMLKQIEKIISEKQPDLMIISGDIFHTSQPSASIQRMFYEAILKMKEARKDMEIVVTAGNHDSPSRHEIIQELWKLHGVHTIGLINRENPEKHILELPGKGIVVMIPYFYEKNISSEYISGLITGAVRKSAGRLPVIVAAHTTVKGCDSRGHDNGNDFTVGGIDSIDISFFGNDFDYLALGHIHKSQTLGKGNVRYSGSPVPVSFDENYPHSVSLVNIDSHGELPNIEEIEIENKIPLITLPSADKWTDWENIKSIFKDFPSDLRAYIRLNVEIENSLSFGAIEEARKIAEEKSCRFCLINSKKKVSHKNPDTQNRFSIREFLDRSPLDIIKIYATEKGVEFDKDLEKIFKEVAEMASRNSFEKPE